MNRGDTMENLINLLKSLFQTDRTNKAHTDKNITVYRKDLRELKIEVLLFTHFMYEDDDRITIFEKLSLINLIKQECDTLPANTEIQFKEWLSDPPSFGYILDYAKENGYSYDDLDNAIRAFVEHTASSSKYHPVIRDVRKKLILEKNYLKK